MKYRHSFHAGNFADVHKHVTLLALLRAMQRKDKGFLYLETHAGRGAYELTSTAGGAGRFAARLAAEPATNCAAELADYASHVREYALERGNPHAYPGSPLLASRLLRPQDRAVFIELQSSEAQALKLALPRRSGLHVEAGNGFERVRAWLPAPQRRALLLIDPPYERADEDLAQLREALSEILLRMPAAVVMIWIPVKDQRRSEAWIGSLSERIERETLVAQLWIYPRDSRVSLNGSCLMVANPPWQIAERMRVWLPELYEKLRVGDSGGTEVRVTGG
jgi:23S rRNA (adenine2030-N6)-methyltransferase